MLSIIQLTLGRWALQLSQCKVRLASVSCHSVNRTLMSMRPRCSWQPPSLRMSGTLNHHAQVFVNEEEDPLLVVVRLRQEVADLRAELRCDATN